MLNIIIAAPNPRPHQPHSRLTSLAPCQHRIDLKTVGASALSTVGARALSTVGARALSTVGAEALS